MTGPIYSVPRTKCIVLTITKTSHQLYLHGSQFTVHGWTMPKRLSSANYVRSDIPYFVAADFTPDLAELKLSYPT